jgi:hypothetical protein
VTATPATRNDRPRPCACADGGVPGRARASIRFSVIWSPGPTPSAWAKAASSTTPPSRTQPPLIGLGWSTAAGAVSRPSVCATTVCPFASMTTGTKGYGPL